MSRPEEGNLAILPAFLKENAMNEGIRKQMMDLQMQLQQQEEKPEEKPKRTNRNKGTSRKGLTQKRYKKADWDNFMDQIEAMMASGEKRISRYAEELDVSFHTANKAVIKLKRRQQSTPDTDITRLLIDQSQAIRILIPLLDHANPIVVKKAKGWLYKIAEWMDE